MTSTDKPAMRISGPAELVTAVPYLLGFHPQDSLVLVGLADNRLVVTGRLDLDDAHDQLLADTITAIVRGGATELIAAVYTEHVTPGAELPYRPTIDRVARAATSADVNLLECLLVSDGRWWSYSCQSPACCPPDGRDIDDATTVFQTQAVVAGLTVAPTRDALADMFTRPADAPDLREAIASHEQIEVNAALTGTARTWTRSAIRALFAAHHGDQAGSLPNDDDIARFAVALRSRAVRDAAWMAIDDRQLSGMELWVNLARRMPSPYDAAPLFLAAWAAFRDGNGALAGIAADKALRSDPDYSAAELLRGLLTQGVDPGRLPRLRLLNASVDARESSGT